MSLFTIDLCVGWSKVAECVDGVFDGVLRNLAAGEWRLTGAVSSIAFDGGHVLSDIDTVRVVEDATIKFAGFVAPVGSGVGGLEIVETADGDQFTLSGSDAWSVFASRVAYPTPATDPPWADAWDLRSGIASTVAAQYISYNAGSSALASRQIPGLTVVDGLTGATGSWSARLQPLNQLVARVCTDGGITCRLVVGFSGAVTATLAMPVDRSSSVILFDQGDLSKIEIVEGPSPSTYVIVGGQGDLTARTFASAGSATGASRREAFVNQTALSSATEVQQAANSALASSLTTLTVRAEVTDVAALRVSYLTDYDLGDTIAVEIDDVRYPVVVESVTVHVGPDRAVIRPVLGDAVPNMVTGLIRDVADLSSRFDLGDGGGSVGPAGPGIAVGGATGSLLNKASATDFDTAWVTRAALAADSAFTGAFAPLHNGVILTDAAQTFTTAVAADITWGTEVSDLDGWTSGGSATLTVPAGKAGRYTICYTGKWSADPGASGSVVLIVNGTNIIEDAATRTATFAFSQCITIMLTLAVGDTIKFQGAQSSGSNKDLVSRLEIG